MQNQLFQAKNDVSKQNRAYTKLLQIKGIDLQDLWGLQMILKDTGKH